jgi:hypothetical protein
MNAVRVATLFMVFLSLAVPGGAASKDKEPPAPSAPAQPDFAAGWRVTGIMKQGGKSQASLENPGRNPRFVLEGDQLAPGVVVEKIDPASRTVTLRRDEERAVIRTGPAPAQAKTAAKSAPAQQPQRPNPPGPPGSFQPPQAMAGQDPQGRWGIRFGNGGFYGAQDYANRFGGVDQAIAHVNQRLSEDSDPYRKGFHMQMLTALQNMRASGQATTAGGVQAPGSPQAMSASGTFVFTAAPAPPAQVVVQPAPPPPMPPPLPNAAPGGVEQPQRLYTPLPPPPGRSYD